MLFGKINRLTICFLTVFVICSCSLLKEHEHTEIIAYRLAAKSDSLISSELSKLDEQILKNDVIAYLTINEGYIPDKRRDYRAISDFSITFEYYPNYRKRKNIDDEKQIWLAARNSNRFIVLNNNNIKIPVVFFNPDKFFIGTTGGFISVFYLIPIYKVFIQNYFDIYVDDDFNVGEFIKRQQEGYYRVIEIDE